MEEAGVRGLDISAWIGLFVPAGTPAPVIARLRAAIIESTDELKTKFSAIGGECMSVDGDKIDWFVATEFDAWSNVIKDANIKLD